MSNQSPSVKHIPISYYEEIKRLIDLRWQRPLGLNTEVVMINEDDIEWIDNNGINTPYLVTTINNTKEKER